MEKKYSGSINSTIASAVYTNILNRVGELRLNQCFCHKNTQSPVTNNTQSGKATRRAKIKFSVDDYFFRCFLLAAVDGVYIRAATAQILHTILSAVATRV